MKKNLAKVFATFAVGLIAFSSLPAAEANFKMPAKKSRLSVNGQRAFDDLGRCLQSQGKNKILDVFYLIDESASLQDTDADNRRAEILSSSLLQLASFRKGVTVNYSVAFFAHSYGVWKPWTRVNQGGIISEAAKIDAQVRTRNNGKFTDWLQGINGAINELNAQNERTGGCGTLVWLTDGGIELPTVDKTIDAIDQLCSNRFDVLRKNKVTVLGVLLKNDKVLDAMSAEDKKQQLLRMAFMQPMVEGIGKLYDGSEQKCGAYPVPANYSQGALFVAQDPKDLAFEFLKLPPRIEGCQASPDFKSEGSEFEVEPGISDFQIVTTSEDWRLTDAKGKPVSGDSPGVKVFETAGASQIRIGTTHSGQGKWNFRGPGGVSELFLCSGLDIEIDKGVNPIAGRPGILSGKVINQKTGKEADLSVYDSNHPITVQQVGNSNSGKKQEAEQSPSAKWVVQKFTPAADQNESEVRITLQLVTKSGFKLAPISISQKLDVRLIANYPTLKNDPIQLTDLVGTTEPATGSAVFVGSTRADGKICIDPKTESFVVKDPVHRADSYQVSTTGLDVNGCAPVRSGESVKVGFKVSNDVTAHGDVVIAVPIAYYSDADPGKSLILNAPVSFVAHTDNEKGKKWWIIGLTILGILLPLALIYLGLWWSHRFAYGRQLQRAEYPIAITTEGRITNRDGSAITTHGDNYIGRPQTPDVRELQDGSATLSAKLPKAVLSEPWYEVKAPEGFRVISVGNIARHTANKKRFASGKLAPTPGDLGKIWYLLISDAALLKAEKGSLIEGKLVIFNRRDNTNLNQHRDSLANVSSKPGLSNDVEKLIAAAKADVQKPKGNGGGSPGGGNNPGGGSTGGGGGRPIPTGGPSRPVGAPGAPGSPSRPSMPGAPSRTGGPTISPISAPGGPSRTIPTSSPNPGAPSRPTPPGAPPPRRGGPGAPA